jgi:hypothetical protein
MPQKSTTATGSTAAGTTKNHEDAIGSIMTMQSEMAERMGAIYAEWAQFLAHRVQEDIKTQQALWSCRGPEDFRKVQEDFLSRAREEYADEMEKLTTMAQEMMTRLSDRR